MNLFKLFIFAHFHCELDCVCVILRNEESTAACFRCNRFFPLVRMTETSIFQEVNQLPFQKPKNHAHLSIFAKF